MCTTNICLKKVELYVNRETSFTDVASWIEEDSYFDGCLNDIKTSKGFCFLCLFLQQEDCNKVSHVRFLSYLARLCQKPDTPTLP